MRKFLLGFLVALLLIVAYFFGKKNAPQTTIKDTGVLQESLKNVSKLVVTEGYYSDIITYKDAKEIYLSWLKAEKKAVVLVNAKATVTYDLSQIKFKVDHENQVVVIESIPEAVLDLYPKLEYYDIQADFLNEFTSKDYTKIADLVDQRLRKKIAQSTLVTNAQNRLLSELYALLNTQGFHYKIELRTAKNKVYNEVLFLNKD